MLLFGAGGAARAIAVELALAGAVEITVANRERTRGAQLVDLLNTKTSTAASLVEWNHTIAIPDGVDIVVNATSVGLFPDVAGRLDLDSATLHPGIVVADVIPNPPRTSLIREAEARGCVAIDGLGMLVNQGVVGIKYWTGVDVDASVMRSTVEEIFSG